MAEEHVGNWKQRLDEGREKDRVDNTCCVISTGNNHVPRGSFVFRRPTFRWLNVHFTLCCVNERKAALKTDRRAQIFHTCFVWKQSFHCCNPAVAFAQWGDSRLLKHPRHRRSSLTHGCLRQRRARATENQIHRETHTGIKGGKNYTFDVSDGCSARGTERGPTAAEWRLEGLFQSLHLQSLQEGGLMR